MLRVRSLLAVSAVCATALLAVGCMAQPVAKSPAASPDPVVAAATEFTHGTSGRIVGYVVDWVPGKAGLELFAMRDGSLWLAGFGKPDYFWQGPHAPARLQPEGESERLAREKTVAAAHLAVTRQSRMMASSVPQVYEYVVEVTLGDGTTQTVAIGPSGAQKRVFVIDKSGLRPWPPKLPTSK